MSAKYSVLQYAPDPMSGEKINIGVFTWNNDCVRYRFLNDWRRVECFASEAPKFLKTFTAHFADAIDNETFDTAVPTWLESRAKRWEESLQFTPIRGSLKNPEELIAEVATIFLKEQSSLRLVDTTRSRRDAIQIASREIQDAVERVSDRAKDVVRKKAKVQGNVEGHEFDIIIEAHRTIAAVTALSFERGSDSELSRQIDATAWNLEDVKNADSNVSLGVYMIRPRQPRGVFERARVLFPKLSGEVLLDEDLPSYAARQASLVV